VLPEEAQPPESAIALVGDLSILVPMEGLIDAAAEAERLGKQLAKAQADLDKTRLKLANENFVRNAPPEVVEAERARVAELERTVISLTAQLERIRRLFKP
jgi:valyl-tRNA synthetase